MRLHGITLGSKNLAAMREFYVGTLGVVEIEYSAQSLALSVGWTTLRFEQIADAEAVIPSHFAFNVPPDGFERAMLWLAQRTRLLAENGAMRFAFDSWRAEACYAMDPDGNVIELIARQRLVARLGDRVFDARALLCLSEIGIVESDPVQIARELCSGFGLPVFSAAGEEFATVGDDEGLFIIVPPGRAWKPTADVMSRAARASVVIGGGTVEDVRWERAPYEIRSAPERSGSSRSV